MSIMQYVKDEDQRDIHIEITKLDEIIDKIKAETKGLYDVSVLLVTGCCRVNTLIQHINQEWTREFYQYLQENRIRIHDAVSITPIQTATIEKPKAIKLA